jgi:predicted MFS family arabinose efflux permease
LTIWLALPVLMIAAFWFLPGASTPVLGLGLFALAGLACSAFFPLTITLASERFPNEVAWVSSMLIAALMVGVGLGSFVIGPLREWLSLEQLYRLSAVYPGAVIGLGWWSLHRS